MFTLSDFYNIINYLDGTTVTTLDANTKILATSEKSLSTQLFTNTIDQVPYATDDYKRLKNFLIDWYSAHRTLISTQKNVSDVFSLPNSSKRELFNGFGYPFSISYLASDTKSSFFLDLVNLYKVKGTPQTLIDVLQYYGLSDIDLAEYWLEKDSGRNLIFRSEKYLPPGVLDISFANISFDDMTINDPHWRLSEQQVENLILANKIALPSKSPYFSIRPRYNLTELIAIISIISRRVQDAYGDYFATGTLTRDIKLTNLNLYVSFLELYLSCIYTFTSIYHVSGSSDPRFFCYDGTSVPDTSIILSQYDNAISRVYSRAEFKSKLSEFYDLFTRNMSVNFLETYNPGTLLSSMNNTLYDVLNLYLDSDNGVELLNYLINDLNAWIINNIGSGYPNLATTVLGLGSLIDLNKIINFFKPYHARIVTLEFALIIDNPLCDSMICEDSVIDNPIETIIDFDTADSTACLTCVDGTSVSDCEFYYSREKYDCGSQFDIGASIDTDPSMNIQDEISDILNFHRDSTSSDSHEQILFADPADMYSESTFCDGSSELSVVMAGGWTDFDYGGTFDGQHGNDIVEIYIRDLCLPQHVFVSEWDNYRVQRFDLDGTYNTKWGSSGSGNGQFNKPEGMMIHNTSIFVADSENNRIQEFDLDGNFVSKYGTFGSGNGQLDYPTDIVAVGVYFYVVDSDNDRIQIFDSNWGYIDQWGSSGSGNGEFNHPWGIDADSDGNIYVVDLLNYRVQKFDSDGNYLLKWGSSGSGNGQFSYHRHVVVDSDDNIYVSDGGNDRIQKFNSSGTYLSKFGSSGSGDGQFDAPRGISIDSDGNIYVVERINTRVQKFDSSGAFLDKWGTSGSGNGQFDYPTGLIVG